MLYLYLDESGDLGFDFFGRKPSRYFTVTILAVKGYENQRKLAKAVKRTAHARLAGQRRCELKGSKDSLAVKCFLYDRIADIPFGLYALTLNKPRVYDHLAGKKDRVYNFIARQVIQKVPLDEASNRISLHVDKCKSKRQVREFDEYVIRQLKGLVDPKVPLDIFHDSSTENPCLQAVDLFCWGIFRRHEGDDPEWYSVFSEKVKHDGIYLP